jgi:thymidylate synthase
MQQYAAIISKILHSNRKREDRTGIGSMYGWGEQARFTMSKGFPATTLRPVPLRWVFEETMFFLRGETDTKILEDKGVTIWKGNTSREFLDARGLDHLSEGDMGKGYGQQWRNFGGTERIVDENLNTVSYGIEGIDQINDLVDGLIQHPSSRRHLVSAWNPQQLDDTPLPPCHILQAYNVHDGKLNSLFWMRSNDIVYGLPFNIAQYAFLLHFFAKVLGLEPGTLVYQAADAHIYLNQIEIAEAIIERYNARRYARVKPELPTIKIHKDLNNLDNILDLEWSDIEVIGYNPMSDFENKPPMAV